MNPQQAFELPLFLNAQSAFFYAPEWSWDSREAYPREAYTLEQFYEDIKTERVWAEGPQNLWAAFNGSTLEIDYGWSYTRFFRDEAPVQTYIEFCSRVAAQLSSEVIYFGPDTRSPHYDHARYTRDIATGVLTAGEVKTRLKDLYGFDVYYKRIT